MSEITRDVEITLTLNWFESARAFKDTRRRATKRFYASHDALIALSELSGGCEKNERSEVKVRARVENLDETFSLSLGESGGLAAYRFHGTQPPGFAQTLEKDGWSVE